MNEIRRVVTVESSEDPLRWGFMMPPAAAIDAAQDTGTGTYRCSPRTARAIERLGQNTVLRVADQSMLVSVSRDDFGGVVTLRRSRIDRRRAVRLSESDVGILNRALSALADREGGSYITGRIKAVRAVINGEA